VYIGHLAVAFAAKRVAPKTSLGTLIAASQMVDLIWPILVLTGLEVVVIDPGNTVVTPLYFKKYPYSHSLVAVVGWASLFALAYWIFTRYRPGAVIVWVVVMSHWVLDVISHRPDLPLYPGGEKLLGFGLWNSLMATLLLEGGMFVAGVVIYMKATSARDRTGKFALWALIIFLIMTYFVNVFGPPPPQGSERVVILTSLLLWILLPWGYWIDRHGRAKAQKATLNAYNPLIVLEQEED